MSDGRATKTRTASRPVAAQSGSSSKARAKVQRAAGAMRQPRLSANTKLTLGLMVVLLAALTGLFVYSETRTSPTEKAIADRLIRGDSHRLSTVADGKLTVVEFLDFECPSCGAAYPGVERLRSEYQGKVTYVVRYFPISSHANARTAAAAAQAAGNQHQFEAMYKRLFDTQSSWGGKQDSQAAVFEGFAQELGLDLTQYRADVADPATADYIQREQNDGASVGVGGTPTFFINGKQFKDQPTYAGLKSAFDAALAA